MRNKAALSMGAVTVGLALAACGGSTTSTPSSSAPSASASGGGNSACQTATVTGQTTNVELQKIATSVYDSLDCSKSESMQAQAQTIAKSPELASKVKAIGGTLTTNTVGGATDIQLVVVKDRSACQVLAMDSPMKGKSLNCGNA